MLICPVCEKKSIGKVGVDQYYCWECCVEFAEKNGDCKVFNIQDDGTLTDFGEQAEIVS